MRGQVVPGSAILAQSSDGLPGDLLLGYAVRARRRWFRRFVVDERGWEWSHVRLVSPGRFRVVQNCHAGVTYLAVQPLQGHSLVPERRHVGRAAPSGCAGVGGATSTRVAAAVPTSTTVEGRADTADTPLFSTRGELSSPANVSR
jgi:hypothetical protein